MAYLFPCSCGKEIPLEPRQAGEQLTCACGAKHTAPTMREIRQLPSTGEENAAPTGNWSMLQGGLFSGGAALVLLGVCALVLLLMLRSQLPTDRPEIDPLKTEQFELWLETPENSLLAWKEFSENRLPPRPPGYKLRWIEAKKLAARNFWQCVLAGSMVFFGLVLAVVSLVMPTPQPKRRSQRPPPAKKPASR